MAKPAPRLATRWSPSSCPSLASQVPRPGCAGSTSPAAVSSCTPEWPEPWRSRWWRCGGDGDQGDIDGWTEQPWRTRAAPPAQPVAGALHYAAVVHGNDWVDEVAAQPRSGANGRSSPAPISRLKGFEGAVPERRAGLPHRSWTALKLNLVDGIRNDGRMSLEDAETMGTATKVWHRCRCAKADRGAP